jgi:hypothetical protein
LTERDASSKDRDLDGLAGAEFVEETTETGVRPGGGNGALDVVIAVGGQRTDQSSGQLVGTSVRTTRH